MATGKINNYMSYINDAFIVRSLNKDNVSVSGNSTFSETFTIPTVSGYTCVGPIGYAITNASSSGENSTYMATRQVRKTNSTDVVFAGRSMTSNSAKIRLYVDLLFARNVFMG